MIIIIRALPQRGKDDGDYDPPISRDETPDEKQRKKEIGQKKEKAQKKKKKEKEGAMLLSFYHTCASK